MGVDLTLMPVYTPDSWLCHDNIDLNRRRELWDAIESLPQLAIPRPVQSFLATNADGDTAYGSLSEDPYGQPLKYTTAGDLLSLKEHPAITDNHKNRAIWAFLAEMPPAWPVVLYWH